MRHFRYYIYGILASMMLLASCAPTHQDATPVDNLPNIYPKYADVTIPVNIAPLNFILRNKHINSTEVCLTIEDGQPVPETLTTTSCDCNVQFDISDWKDFMQKAVGKKVSVQVYGRNDDGNWLEYKPFHWEVVGDSIDPYITYQLIEPDYKVWNRIQIKQRCLESFREKMLADHHLMDNRCMNCHILGNQDPNLSMLFIQGDGREAVLNRNGKLRKLCIDKEGLVTPATYYNFSPSGKYIAFSTNQYEPAFHADPKKRIEVYDTKSDVYVANLDNNTILTSPLTSQEDQLETFPTFSPDGKYIYYCVANGKGLNTANLKGLKYVLVRIPFDEKTGHFGTEVDTLYTAHSVCHPKMSPDGRFCLFTISDYGTCPAWHPEADLCMLNLLTGEVDSLKQVNSDRCDGYHSWSHNSHWFVFCSKRDDGLYSHPYICYVDAQGKTHKPFLMPMKEPTFYDDCLKSFNIPELSRGEIPFNAIDIESIKKKSAEKFK